MSSSQKNFVIDTTLCLLMRRHYAKVRPRSSRRKIILLQVSSAQAAVEKRKIDEEHRHTAYTAKFLPYVPPFCLHNTAYILIQIDEY